MAVREDVYALIDAERERQARMWNKPHAWGEGDCSGKGVAPAVKAVVLSEECGEVSRAVLDSDGAKLQEELVQVAAIAVAWLEGMVD